MLEIVFTERVALASDDDPQPTAPLLAALQHKDPIVQVWGHHAWLALKYSITAVVLAG
jgi:hypothetical protein